MNDTFPMRGNAGAQADPTPARPAFQPEAFDLSRARLLARFAWSAYFEADVSSPVTDTHAIVRDLGECIVVAFRGTASIANFIEDADCRKTKTPHGRVHSGFYRDWDSIYIEVVRAIEALPLKPLLITGHSLGGALAVLFASRLQVNHPIDSIYTFGQPRVGDREWADWYDETLGRRTFRIRNEEDVVPLLPGVLAGFRHCGQEIFFPEPVLQFLSPIQYWLNPPWWKKVLSDCAGLYAAWRQRRETILLDHHIDRYIERMGT